jgi:hypothetical protein
MPTQTSQISGVVQAMVSSSGFRRRVDETEVSYFITETPLCAQRKERELTSPA